MDHDDNQRDACHLLRPPASLRGVREVSRTDLKALLCVKQGLTSRGKGQSPPLPHPHAEGGREGCGHMGRRSPRHLWTRVSAVCVYLRGHRGRWPTGR